MKVGFMQSKIHSRISSGDFKVIESHFRSAPGHFGVIEIHF